MRKTLVILATLALALAVHPTFDEFVERYNKVYATAEERAQRQQVYQDALPRIDALNARRTTATFGASKFADLTPEEFRAKYLAPTDMSAFKNQQVAQLYTPAQLKATPTSIDWRTLGAVTPIKNQEQCGSCWAFSTTGNVEGQWFLAGHNLTGLSEQNLVDCDTVDQGCDGGLMGNAFEYIMKNGGIDTEDSYPYMGVDGTCSFTTANIGAKISNWTMIASDEDQMAAYCAEHGPVSIAVDAVEWQYYMFGIFQSPWCGTTLDHGVLIVGFDHQIDFFGQDMPFWWVKNSWGTDWGYSGYIKLAKGYNECADNLYPCSSIIDS